MMVESQKSTNRRSARVCSVDKSKPGLSHHIPRPEGAGWTTIFSSSTLATNEEHEGARRHALMLGALLEGSF